MNKDEIKKLAIESDNQHVLGEQEEKGFLESNFEDLINTVTAFGVYAIGIALICGAGYLLFTFLTR